MESSTILSIKR